MLDTLVAKCYLRLSWAAESVKCYSCAGNKVSWNTRVMISTNIIGSIAELNPMLLHKGASKPTASNVKYIVGWNGAWDGGNGARYFLQ